MNKFDKTVNKIFPTIALPIIAVAGVLLIVLMLADTRGKNNENNAYIRVINCIVSYNASDRTQEQIENCYVTVEHDLNIKLQRYDSSDK